MFSFQETRFAKLAFLFVLLMSLMPHPGAAQEAEGPADMEEAEPREVMSSNPTGEKVPWQAYVEMAGNKLACHFTVEMFHNDDISVPVESGSVMDNEEVSTVEELIAKVSREVKGIVIVRNTKNPAIIHMIDERLKKINDYPLEKNLTIAFSGTLDELVWAGLAKRLPTMGSQCVGLIGDVFGDDVTNVRVNARDQKIREILTDCVPLDVYGPILWGAGTRSTTGQMQTNVEYHGPDRRKAIFWEEFVATTAEKLNCYITIEQLADRFVAEGVPIRHSPLGSKYLPRSQKTDTIEGLVEMLRRELDEVRVIQDAENPSIIHLVDEPLLKIDGYFMDRKVDLDYSGPLGGMLVALEAKYPNLGLATKVSQSVGVTTKVVEVVGDKVTPVRVAAKNQAVRDLLTRSVPLKGYHRILWKSETGKTEGKYASWVRYSGPKTNSKKPADAPAEHKSSKEKENVPRKGGIPNRVPPLTVCATTMAGRDLIEDLSAGFAIANGGGKIGSDLTMRWFPFGEFIAGRFAGLLYTTASGNEKRIAEPSLGGEDTLQGSILGELRLVCVAHPDNHAYRLTLKSVGRFLKDSTTSWKTVGGPNHKATCYVESDESISRELIQWKCMTWRNETGGGRHPFRKDAVPCATPAELIQKVAVDRSGFGLFLFDPSDTKVGMLLKRVKVLKVAGTKDGPFVEPMREPVIQTDYPLSEPVVLYLHPNAPAASREFCQYCAGEQGASIAFKHGLITPRAEQQYLGKQRLAEAKAGKGTEITVCDMTGSGDVLKDLSLEFVKAKTAVQLKFQKAETRDVAVERFDKGSVELLLADGPISESKDIKAAELGRMAVAVIVHSENSLESLPLDEVRGIFTGEIKKWPAVRGAAPAIKVFGLKQASSTALLLKEKLNQGGGKKVLKYTPLADHEKVLMAVARDPAAIGFVDMSQLSPTEKSVRVVPVFDGTGPQPSPKRERKGKDKSQVSSPEIPNPLEQTLTLYVSPNASQTAKDFAEFLTPEHCKETIAQYNLLAPRHAENTKQLASRPKPAVLPKEKVTLTSADEPLPLLLDDPDAAKKQPRAKSKEPVAKPTSEAKPSEPTTLPVPPTLEANDKPVPVAESKPASATDEPKTSGLTDDQTHWLYGSIAAVLLSAVSIGWLSAPKRKKPRR